tara:strand:- start:147 stop:1088 length:942 start_codon:yes stop_codon:yes gene_type:complete
MILITGTTGYIGSEITKALYKKNIKYFGIDNLIYSNKKNILNKKNFKKLDIGSHKVKNIIKKYSVKTVIHCAALSYILDGEKNRSKYISNNIKKTKKFINICKNANVENLIFLSSSNVYKDGPKTFSENSVTKPKNLYGKTKLTIENYLKRKNFKSLIILRLFNVMGLSDDFFVFKFVKNDYQRLFFKLNNTKAKVSLNYKLINKKKFFPERDFIDVRDVVFIILKLANMIKIKKINQIFNIGSGKSTSIIKIYQKFNKLKKIKKKNIKFKKISSKELNITRANINKIKKFLLWSPRFNLTKSINSTLKFAKY